ncbi:MAG: methyltransferase domain-containing protein [Myxacorys californica WJT36-NPBG1]|jgi:protein-L-isoaspartate(D-aspartate) O-methyltransferase|nr:methyltransferase domain-containing protein [Myxacorys californica WJT36-NPBG1]
MQSSEYETQYKQNVIDFFNSRTSYDNDYTIRRSLPILDLIPFQPGQRVLDVATGTGIIAIAAAQAVGREGQVIGVDFSSGMLAQAQRKIQELGLQNVELVEADIETINFEHKSFDVILCSSAIVYFKDIQATLQNWYHWLKNGGIVGFSSSSNQSCEAPRIIEVAAKHGVTVPNINEPTGTPERCRQLLEDVGFEDIEVKAEQMGFYKSVEQARQWNGGWFHPTENPLLNLTSEQLNTLIASYVEDIEAKATERGVWYENMTFFAVGRKERFLATVA